MKEEFRIVVLLSGRGSNFQNLLRTLKHALVAAVLSDKPDAPGLRYAEERKIPVFRFSRKEFASVAEQKAALFRKVIEIAPDLVVLAGYMQIVPESFICRMPGKIVNVHPSLLPKFPGLHTHQRALDAGEKTHGCSVHFVDNGVDTGPLIAQRSCPVLPGDTADSLAARVLEAEHLIFPWVIDEIARGGINLSGRTIQITPEVAAAARKRGFDLPPSSQVR